MTTAEITSITLIVLLVTNTLLVTKVVKELRDAKKWKELHKHTIVNGVAHLTAVALTIDKLVDKAERRVEVDTKPKKAKKVTGVKESEKPIKDKRIKWTDEIREELVAMREKGKTFAQIAKKYKSDPSTIRAVIKRGKLKPRPGAMSPADINLAKKHRREGKSYLQIAKILGVSHSTVFKNLKRSE